MKANPSPANKQLYFLHDLKQVLQDYPDAGSVRVLQVSTSGLQFYQIRKLAQIFQHHSIQENEDSYNTKDDAQCTSLIKAVISANQWVHEADSYLVATTGEGTLSQRVWASATGLAQASEAARALLETNDKHPIVIDSDLKRKLSKRSTDHADLDDTSLLICASGSYI